MPTSTAIPTNQAPRTTHQAPLQAQIFSHARYERGWRLCNRGPCGRVTRGVEFGAARHRNHAYLLDRPRMLRPEPPEDVRVDLDDGRITAGNDGGRARFAGQQRHL